MKNIYKIFIGILFIINSGFTQTNYSLDFSVGNYGRIPISATLSDFETFTMECWYYETGFTGGDERIVAHESANSAVGSFGISNGAGSYSASIEDGSTGLGGSNIATIVQNTWSHLAMTYDGITFRFFINGVQELSEVGDLNNFGPDSDDITINRHTWNTGSSSRLTGQLDELRISNIARYTENFTPQNYEFESDENTMGLWHFNQDFNDYSGNGNHGAHNGTGYSENVPPTPGEVSATDVLIEEITLLATEYQALESSVLSDGTEYYLKVTGTYGYGGWSSPECVDGSFAYCGQNDIVHVRVWTWNGLDTQLPYPDEYNSNHIYYFYFTGDGTTEEFGFVDNGGYGDNSGYLTIQIWRRAEEATTATNYSVSFDYMDGYASSDASSETIFQGVTSFSVEVWYKNPGVLNGPNSNLPGNANIVTNYRRIGGGDPYNNFNLSMDSPISSNTGYISFMGTLSNELLDDDQWHHLAGVYDHDNSVSYLFIDGVLNDTDGVSGDFLSSYNKLYINNHAPFAGEYHMECDVAGLRITDGVRYSSNFSPSFPLASEANSIIALDFSAGDGTTLADLSGNGNNFSLYDAASWTTDVPEVTTTATNTYSLSFDGVDDYLETGSVSNISTGNSSHSISAWVMVDALPSNRAWMLTFGTPQHGDHHWLLNSNGTTKLGVYDGTQVNPSLSVGQWTHITITSDGTYLKGYLNGSLNETKDMTQSSNSWPTFNLHGTILHLAKAREGENFFQGKFDEVAIWNEAISAAEITALYNSGLGLDASSNSGNYTSSSNLQGYWRMNEGTGSTVTDASDNSNTGTIYGATWSTDVPFAGATTTSALTWSIRAKASLSTYNDNDNYLGVASSATNVFDASYDELEPPVSPGSSISLYFPHAEWNYLLGDNFSTDARPVVALTDTMQVWDFVVKSTDAGTATLTFVYASVPSVPVILENTATGARQTLSNNATYTFTAVADSAHPFRVSIGDTTAPTLTLGASCSGPAILISDSTHTLGWTSTDGFEVDSVLVSFSSDSGTTYSLQASLGTASSYNWTVPDAMVMTGGKLKLKAQDYAGNSKEEVSSYVFAIAGDSLSSAVTAGWTLWGAPINPTNDAMTTNLADDFSGYWVTFDYVDNGYTYNGILKEAEGYWLGSAQNATVDVKGTPVDSNFTVSLSQGWELISNPLVLDVSVDSLTFTKNNTTKTHAEAVSAGWVNSIYSYGSTGYVPAATFSPWSGYWMAVLETGIEMTYPIHRVGGSRSSRLIENEWMISFDAQVDGSNDGITMIGYAETATDGFDTEHDAVKPPNPPGPVYVSLFIAHPEWNYPLGDKFTKDIRAAVPANSYQEWQLTMESSESDAQLSWTLLNIPNDYEVGYSTDGGQYFDNMQDVSTITISANTEITVRVGSQVLGIDDEPIPTVFALHQNYPNPFNPVTTLRYDLPENGIVTITIYDMLGRQVKTLINQTQDAGFKSVVWNATNDYGKSVSAGIYLYQIRVGEYISTKKMVLLK